MAGKRCGCEVAAASKWAPRSEGPSSRQGVCLSSADPEHPPLHNRRCVSTLQSAQDAQGPSRSPLVAVTPPTLTKIRETNASSSLLATPLRS